MKIQEDYSAHPRRWWHLPLLIVLVIGTIYAAYEYNQGRQAVGAWERSGTHQHEGMVFGTIYHISYHAPRDLQEGIEQTLQEVDNSLSPFNPNSVITAINTGRSHWADRRLAEVAKMTKAISEETDGAFDITVAPLVNAWGFGFRSGERVDDSAIDSLLQFVGFGKINIALAEHPTDSCTALISKQDERIMLDCSAIAKGYGVDAVGLYLESQGVKDYMVEIGGELRVRGCNPKGDSWHIGIIKPIDDSLSVNSELQEVIEVGDIAMATSGNYRNFYEKDHKKYAHTIDPRTGHPVQHSILSATVLAADCATADAYATAFMVEGMEGAQRILQKHPELQAYFIYTDSTGNMQTWRSPNFPPPLDNSQP